MPLRTAAIMSVSPSRPTERTRSYSARTFIWKDVLGLVITVPLPDAVVVVIGDCLRRLSSGVGGTRTR